MYACLRIHMPICMHFCVFTCIDRYFLITWHIIATAHNICVYGPVYVYMYVCMYVCTYVCMRMYIYVYMYVYVCIGVCMHIYIYIYKLS